MPSNRLDALPAHLFNELEWQATALSASGTDVIFLAFGNPDQPTYTPIVEAGQRALARAQNHGYSSNLGSGVFRDAVAEYYWRRFGVVVDPLSMVVPALGAKECIFNLNLSLLDAGDVALAPDPGYQIYTAGPLLVGAHPVALPLVPELGHVPDFSRVPSDVLDRARVLYLNYPNTPTGAVVPGGFFEHVIALAERHDFVVIHDNVYADITFDGYVAPSILATPGALEVCVEVMSLSKTHNMAGWRCAALVGNPNVLARYRRLKSFVDSGMFGAVQAAGAAALSPSLDRFVAEANETYRKRRDAVCEALLAIGFDLTPPKGTLYVWARIPTGLGTAQEFCFRALHEASVALSPGSAYGAGGEGFVRLSLTATETRLVEAVNRISKIVPIT